MHGGWVQLREGVVGVDGVGGMGGSTANGSCFSKDVCSTLLLPFH